MKSIRSLAAAALLSASVEAANKPVTCGMSAVDVDATAVINFAGAPPYHIPF
jgi:hypothetical protein